MKLPFPIISGTLMIALFVSIDSLFAQNSRFSEKNYTSTEQEIFDALKSKDSLLFKLGFNTCDTAQFRQLISDDFEFYHDQSGVVESKEIFISGISNLCNMNYKPTRELKANSLEIYPLYNRGALYGAIQKGVHEFYGEEKGKAKYLTSTARFTHVWILEGKEWRLKRVLSYDHVVPE